jgi:hypothetical protein
MAGIPNGPHTLSVTAADDIGTERIVSIPFTLDAGPETPYVQWLDTQLTLSARDFPRPTLLRPFDTAHIQSITIYEQAAGSSSRRPIDTITDMTNLFDGHLQYVLANNPGTGNWIYSTDILTSDGQTIRGGNMLMTIQ